MSSPAKSDEPNLSHEGIETKIPEGFVIVPIELFNKSSFSSLVGGFTLVDLFSITNDGKRNKKIASFVKLLRAPLNPDEFAALVPEDQASDLISTASPLYATIRNPNSAASGQQKKSPSTMPHFLVEYEQWKYLLYFHFY